MCWVLNGTSGHDKITYTSILSIFNFILQVHMTLSCTMRNYCVTQAHSETAFDPEYSLKIGIGPVSGHVRPCTEIAVDHYLAEYSKSLGTLLKNHGL